MKKLTTLAAVATATLVGAAVASATPINDFTLYTPYGANIDVDGGQIGVIDPAPGSALSINTNPVAAMPWLGQGTGDNPGVSNPFETLFQLYVGNFTRSDGSGFDRQAGLNGSNAATRYEYTAIGRLWETATNLGGQSTNFSIAAAQDPTKPAFLEMYADTYANIADKANVAAGTGFAEGDLILKATPTAIWGSYNVQADTNSNGIVDNMDVGTGSVQVLWHVDWYNTAYFEFPWANPMLWTTMHVNNTLDTPPEGAHTTQMWDGTTPDYYGMPGGTGTPYTTDDLLFKLDGNLHFTPVPEPGTMVLLGSGLLGLAGIARKRKS